MDRETATSAEAETKTKTYSFVFCAVLLVAFFALFFFSLAIVSDYSLSFHVRYTVAPPQAGMYPALALTGLISFAFVFARFSFGYFAGFYMFAMIAGYFWINAFSLFGYDRFTALISAITSLVTFLIPALFARAPAKPFFVLSSKTFDLIPISILVFSAFILIVCYLSGSRFVGLSEMYRYRNDLVHSRIVEYAIGNINGALIPFAFACFVTRRRWILLALLIAISLMYYPVTLTKVTLFLSVFLIFVAIMATFIKEAKVVVILSLLIPLTIGLIARAFSSDFSNTVFGTLNFRMLAIPSISLEHYYEFFSDHPLTYYCQISWIKGFMDCPYTDQLGTVMANWFGLGNMNASLFDTEGVASVGPIFAPLATLVCGLVIAVGNKASSGLPKEFVLVSGAIIPHILLNVPLSTTLLSNGLGLLMLLWYLTPRDYFICRT